MAASDAAPDADFAAIIARLGPIADQLGSRAVVAQYEADIADPALTRAGTAFAASLGALPRFLPVRDVLRIIHNLLGAVPPEAVPNRYARSTRMPTDDNLASTLPYAPSLRAALDLVARYGVATVPWYQRSLTRHGAELRISYGPVVPLGRITPLATEIAMTSIHRIVETFVGDRIGAARVVFSRSPVTDPAVIAARFGCSVTVSGGDDDFMGIPAAWERIPSPYFDAAAWREGVARCDADIRALAAPPLVVRVQLHAEQALAGGLAANLAATAQALALSSRTLVRNLAQHGTTHHAIADGVRRQRAERLLADRALSLADVADQLGFTDPANFGRKCRSWFGASPAKARAQLIAAADAA